MCGSDDSSERWYCVDWGVHPESENAMLAVLMAVALQSPCGELLEHQYCCKELHVALSLLQRFVGAAVAAWGLLFGQVCGRHC